MPPPRSTSVPTQPPANQPLIIVRGKPVVSEFPTPNISDRVFRIRKDSRSDNYKLPTPGDKYEGKYAELLEDFVFATAKPADEAGQVDWFYVNRRLNQNAYNFEIDYPYVDRDYPRVTRTYVVFRSDIEATKEPQADTADPVFELLVLTDHQLQRLQDPIIDSVFVQVKRTFERLPSPIITTYTENQFQQRVTTRAQEVVKSDPPRLSATVEEGKQDRTGTAKAKNTVSTVPRVFPGTTLTEEIPSIIREEYMGGFTERQSSQRVAGQALIPVLGIGEITKTEKQDTEFIKTITRHYQDMPQVRDNDELTEEFGGGLLEESIEINTPSSGLSTEQGLLVTESRLRRLGDFGKIRITKKLRDAVAWPILHGAKISMPSVDEGFRVLTDQQYVDPASPIAPGLTERDPHDKWRVLQKTHHIEPQDRHHQETTEEYGGGILDEHVQTDAAGLVVEEGYLVTDSKLKNFGDFGQVRRTRKLNDTAWPILHGEHVETDGIYAGIKILFDKQVVPAGTPNPGGFTDMDPHDKWRTIQITSRVDLSTLPKPVTYADVEHIDLPPTLLSVFGVFSDGGGFTQTADDTRERASVQVSSTVSGSIGHNLAEGYRGPARALITRSFFASPPSLAQIPVPLKIIPVVGTATLIGRHVEFTQGRGTGFAEDGNSGQLRRETVEFRPALTGSFISSNLHFQGAAGAAFAQSGANIAQLFLPGTSADITISVPLSTPGTIVSGQSMLWKVDVREWKYGIWVMEVMNVIVP